MLKCIRTLKTKKDSMVSLAKITCLNKVWDVHCPLLCINKKIKPFIDFKKFSIEQEGLTEDQSVFVNIYGV